MFKSNELSCASCLSLFYAVFTPNSVQLLLTEQGLSTKGLSPNKSIIKENVNTTQKTKQKHKEEKSTVNSSADRFLTSWSIWSIMCEKNKACLWWSYCLFRLTKSSQLRSWNLEYLALLLEKVFKYLSEMIKYQIYNVADLSGNILHIVSQTDFAQTSECSQAKGGPSVNYSTEIKCKVCLSWCIMFGQPRCFKCLLFFLFFLPPTPSPLYNSHPRIYRHPLLWRGGGHRGLALADSEVRNLHLITVCQPMMWLCRP